MKKAILIMTAALLIGSLALAAGYGRGQMNSQANYGAGSAQRMGYMYGATATSTVAPLRNFVDENEDGVCDLCGEDGVPALDGTGKRFGAGTAVRMGYRYGVTGDTATSTAAPLRNFVDENEDGVCDLCGEDGVPALDGTGKRFGIMGTVGSRMNYGQSGSMRRAIPSESVEMGTAGTFRRRMRDAFSCQMPVRNNMHWRYNPEFGNSVSKP